MKFTSHFSPVSLQDIDFEDITYNLLPWHEEPTPDLIDSIKQFGILLPPLLLERQKDKYLILTGRKRLLAAKQYCPEEKITCNLVSHDIKQKIIFSLLLEEILSRRSMSIVEQIVFLEKFLKLAPTQEALSLLEKLGHKPQEHFLHDLLKLRSLHPHVLSALHRGAILLKNSGKILTFSLDDQKIVADLISKLKLGGSKQRKLIELCKEITIRRNVSLEQILSECPFYEPKITPKNIPQVATGILSWFEKMCFPQSNQKEENFRRDVASLNLPKTMHVAHTPSFEDDTVKLAIHFANWQIFSKAVPKIKQHIEQENTKENSILTS